MKKYFVKYYGYSNVYDLVYTQNEEQEKQAEKANYERISRKQAEKLCAREKDRREYDQAFSGYAPIKIVPIDFDSEKEDMYSSRFTIDGYLVIRR